MSRVYPPGPGDAIRAKRRSPRTPQDAPHRVEHPVGAGPVPRGARDFAEAVGELRRRPQARR